MPGRSCPEWEPGHWVGRWSGNGQFHLIKHNAVVHFPEENKSKGQDRGDGLQMPGALEQLSRDIIRGSWVPRVSLGSLLGHPGLLSLVSWHTEGVGP